LQPENDYVANYWLLMRPKVMLAVANNPILEHVIYSLAGDEFDATTDENSIVIMEISSNTCRLDCENI